MSSPSEVGSRKWRALVDYALECVEAESTQTFVPLDTTPEDSPWFVHEGPEMLISGRADRAEPGVALAAHLDKAAERRSGSAKEMPLIYGWPSVVVMRPRAIGRGGAPRRCITPLFVVQIEKRKTGSGWVLTPGHEPELNLAALAAGRDNADAADEVRKLKLPFGDPEGMAEVAAEAADLLGYHTPDLDPDTPEDIGPNTGVEDGVHNAAVYLVAEFNEYRTRVAQELQALRQRDDWEGTAAAWLVGRGDRTKRAKATPTVAPLQANRSQERILEAVRTEPLTVVTGPPGTGKTQLVVNAAANAWLDGESVLIASTNNSAVDVAVQRADESVALGLLVRTGRREVKSQVAQTVSSAQSAARGYAGPRREATVRALERAARQRAARMAHAEQMEAQDRKLLEKVQVQHEARDELTETAAELMGEEPTDLDELRAKARERGAAYLDVRKRLKAAGELRDKGAGASGRDRLQKELQRCKAEQERAREQMEEHARQGGTRSADSRLEELRKEAEGCEARHKEAIERLRMTKAKSRQAASGGARPSRTSMKPEEVERVWQRAEKLADKGPLSYFNHFERRRLREAARLPGASMKQIAEWARRQQELAAEAERDKKTQSKIAALEREASQAMRAMKAAQQTIEAEQQQRRAAENQRKAIEKKVKDSERAVCRARQAIESEERQRAKAEAQYSALEQEASKVGEGLQAAFGGGRSRTRDILEWLKMEERLTGLEREFEQLRSEQDAHVAEAPDKALIRREGRAWAEKGLAATRVCVAEKIAAARPEFSNVSQHPQSFSRAVKRAMKEGLLGWGCTNLSIAGSFPLEAGLFDVVIVDEASQCSLVDVLPVAYRAKSIVVAGDPNQLRAISVVGEAQLRQIARRTGHDDEELRNAGLHHREGSAYEAFRYASSAAPALLDEHYRCHPHIAKWFNKAFYGGELEVLTDVSAVEGKRVLVWRDVVGDARRPRRGEKRPRGGWVNEEQAKAAAKIVEDLIEPGVTVGVVAPYAAQGDYVDHLVRRKMSEEALREARFVSGTAHRLQGSERDAIVFVSTLAPNMPSTSAGWVEQERNLINVAVSRARRVLVVIGHPETKSGEGSTLTSLREHILGIEREGCAEGSRAAPIPTHSDAERLLLEAMRKRGLDPLGKVDVEGFELDFALMRDGVKINVEVDGDQHLDVRRQQRRSDLARDEVLAKIGWKVVRIPAWRCHAEPEAAAHGVLAEYEQAYEVANEQ